MLALIVHILHRILVYFNLFGFLLPKKYLIYHLFLWPIILIHWLTNNNKCFLTQLEIQLSGNNWGKKESDFGIGIAKSFGINLSKKETDKISITLATISWLISLIRFVLI